MSDNQLGLNTYELQYFVEHLEAENRIDEIHWLLWLDYIEEGQIPQRKSQKIIAVLKEYWSSYLDTPTFRRHWPVWYLAKVQARGDEVRGDLEGFLDDVRRASHLAYEAGKTAQSSETLGKAINYQYRYALLNASINGIATNLPLPLVLRLVEYSVWRPTQALAYVQQVPDEEQRVEALAMLAPYLVHEHLKVFEQVLEQIQRLESQKQQATVLSSLAKYFPEPLLQRALDLALKIEYKETIDIEHNQLRALQGLAPYLSEALFEQVLDSLQPTWSDYDLRSLLKALAPYLSASQLRQTLAMVKETRFAFSWDRRFEIQAVLLPYLAQKGSPEEAWVKVEEIPTFYEGWQMVARARIIPYLPQEWRAGAVVQLVEAVQRQVWIDYIDESSPARYFVLLHPKEGAVKEKRIKEYKPEQIAALLPYLPDDLFQQGLDSLLQSWPADYGAWVFPALVKSLPDHRHEEVLQQILSRRQVASSQVFGELIPLLSQSLMQQALDVARKIKGIEDKVLALKMLMSRLPIPLQREAVTLVLDLPHQSIRFDTLAEWACYLDETTVRKVLAEVAEMQDIDWQAQIRMMLASALSEPLRSQIEKQAWEAIEKMTYKPAEKLAALIPYLSENYQSRAFAFALSSLGIKDDKERALACVHLLLHLPESQVGAYLPQVIQTVAVAFPRNRRTSIAAEIAQTEREEALTPLLPLLARYGHANQAIEFAEEREGKAKVVALARLVAALPIRLREQILWRSFTKAQAYTAITDWAEGLGETAISLPEPMLRQLDKLIREISDESTQARTLIVLTKHLPKPLLATLFHTTDRFQDRAARVELLATFAHYLPQPARNEAIQQLQAVALDGLPAELIAKVTPWLSEAAAEKSLRQTLIEVLERWDHSIEQGMALRSIVPFLPFSLLQEATEIALAFKEVSDQVLALAGLVASLPEPLCNEIATQVFDKLSGVGLNHLGEAQILGEIIRFLPEQLHGKAVERSLRVLTNLRVEFPDKQSYRVRAAKVLTTSLAQMPRTQLYPAWSEELARLANQQRKILLNSLEDLMPITVAIGGHGVVGETLQAIQRVERWWP